MAATSEERERRGGERAKGHHTCVDGKVSDVEGEDGQEDDEHLGKVGIGGHDQRHHLLGPAERHEPSGDDERADDDVRPAAAPARAARVGQRADDGLRDEAREGARDPHERGLALGEAEVEQVRRAVGHLDAPREGDAKVHGAQQHHAHPLGAAPDVGLPGPRRHLVVVRRLLPARSWAAVLQQATVLVLVLVALARVPVLLVLPVPVPVPVLLGAARRRRVSCVLVFVVVVVVVVVLLCRVFVSFFLCLLLPAAASPVVGARPVLAVPPVEVAGPAGWAPEAGAVCCCCRRELVEEVEGPCRARGGLELVCGRRAVSGWCRRRGGGGG